MSAICRVPALESGQVRTTRSFERITLEQGIGGNSPNQPQRAAVRPPLLGLQPLLSEFGTRMSVEVRFWPGLEPFLCESPLHLSSRTLLARHRQGHKRPYVGVSQVRSWSRWCGFGAILWAFIAKN